MDQQQQQQHQQNGQAQGIQGQKARQQAQQEPPQRQPRPERPERLFVTTMSNITYKYMPIIFGILFITAGTLVLTYTFMDHPLPRKVAWGMIGSFGGVCVFFLLGMICLFLDKNCEEKKAWNKRASRASIAFDIEHGLDSPSCPHRCANRVEGYVLGCVFLVHRRRGGNQEDRAIESLSRSLTILFKGENPRPRRDSHSQEGERADDRHARRGRNRSVDQGYRSAPNQEPQQPIRRAGPIQDPIPRTPDLGHSELANNDGTLQHPPSSKHVQRSQSNQESFHDGGATLQRRFDGPRHQNHGPVGLPKPPPSSMNHLKAMKAQIWRVELAFTPENGAITECPQSPGSADDHELEEDRQEIPPEQTQAIQQENRLSEYGSSQSSTALNTRSYKQGRSRTSNQNKPKRPNTYSEPADLNDLSYRSHQEQRTRPSLRRTRTIHQRQGTKHRSGRHHRQNIPIKMEENIERNFQVGYGNRPPRLHLDLRDHEKVELFPGSELAGSNDQYAISEGRMNSPTLGAGCGVLSDQVEEQYENGGDAHEMGVPPSEHSYPPFI
ncbi:hypothetical protein L207DRAFT_531703 [Hyaloscypha variabilis F]|uniref:Uncharacterized protein n=1 Tax=Hyaloscypha variabilis (strain UAMH 11265 / GT02V1 / F) TaxID=1149755 RepID=A0A2J6RFW9_HYAVF|nr:hypothetical protein L207DRAFT_531703 [Hyaloscypha variabilis F]